MWFSSIEVSADYCKTSELERLSPVIFERKLQAIVVHVETVAKIHTSAELELTSDGDWSNGFIEQVADSIVSLVEIRGILRVRVLDVQHGVAERTGEMVIPSVIH